MEQLCPHTAYNVTSASILKDSPALYVFPSFAQTQPTKSLPSDVGTLAVNVMDVPLLLFCEEGALVPPFAL